MAALLFLGNVANAQDVNVNLDSSAEMEARRSRGLETSTNANVNANASRGENASSTSEDTEMRRNTGQTASSTAGMSLKAREIRGWSEEEKSDFLLSVKSHAELQSGQDLENFAKGVLARDENVERVEADEEKVEVSYKIPARFLGIFGAELSAVTDVSFDAETNTPNVVRVNYPWYKMFFSLEDEARADVLQSSIESNVQGEASASTNIHARNGRVIQLISSILKNVRASVEAEVETETETEVEAEV